jgi:transcriptional regulator with XRE-family HTH domain
VTVRADGDWSAVGDAVEARMVARKISTAGLARKTGLSETTIRAVRKGRGNPQRVTLSVLSTGLGWPPDYLCRVAEREPLPVKGPALTDTVGRIARQVDALCRHFRVASFP